MKCITESGYLPLNSLGTGVDSTTSPREENLTIRIFIILILFFSNLKLKSQSSLDSILFSKKKNEFDIGEMNRNFWVKENAEHFLVLSDIENGRNLKWIFKTFDRELNPLNDTVLVLDRSYTVRNINSDDKYLTFSLKNYSNEKDYLYVKYDYIKYFQFV